MIFGCNHLVSGSAQWDILREELPIVRSPEGMDVFRKQDSSKSELEIKVNTQAAAVQDSHLRASHDPTTPHNAGTPHHGSRGPLPSRNAQRVAQPATPLHQHTGHAASHFKKQNSRLRAYSGDHLRLPLFLTRALSTHRHCSQAKHAFYPTHRPLVVVKHPLPFHYRPHWWTQSWRGKSSDRNERPSQVRTSTIRT
jgi:hypothetical protein